MSHGDKIVGEGSKDIFQEIGLVPEEQITY